MFLKTFVGKTEKAGFFTAEKSSRSNAFMLKGELRGMSMKERLNKFEAGR